MTLFCASVPETSQAPYATLPGSIELIQVAWDLPTDNGGSSVLGFFLYMKLVEESSWTLIYDGGEDPATKMYTLLNKVDHLGNPLVDRDYLFAVSSRNIVGTSPMSASLTLNVALRSSAALSTLSGAGIVSGRGAVLNTINLVARDENGSLRSAGGDLIFLHVEQLCKVTDNYRCDLSLDQDSVR